MSIFNAGMTYKVNSKINWTNNNFSSLDLRGLSNSRKDHQTTFLDTMKNITKNSLIRGKL